MTISRSTLIAAAFFACLMLEVVTLLFVTDYWALEAMRDDQQNRPYQAAGLAIFAGTVIILHYRRILHATSRVSALTFIFIIFTAFCIASALWSISPVTSVVYALANVGAFVAVKGAFQWDVSGRAPAVGLIAVVTFFVVAIATLGISGRFIGGNQPNIMGSIAFAGVVFAQFLKNKKATVIATLGLMILEGALSSRTYLLCTLIFLIVLGLLHALRSRRGPAAVFAGSAALILLVTFMTTLAVSGRHSALGGVAEYVFALDDSQRGLGSGLSGRTTYWERGLRMIERSPVVGYGFRTRGGIEAIDTRKMSSHSGYLNLMLDVGVLGFLLFLAMIAVSAGKRIRIYLRERMGADTSFDNTIYLAYLPTMLFVMGTEPTHLYLGLPIHMLNFMCLFAFRKGLRTRRVFRARPLGHAPQPGIAAA